MSNTGETKKSLPTAPNAAQVGDVAKREEEVLAFWKENKIFEKSLEKPAPNGEFVFYDGPPFATGLPHTGSLLSSIIKDVIPRYKTMRGYRVRRRWGWDCHGLPIESLIEKRLNLKTKKDILDVGIDTFNEAARASVLEFEHEWEKYVDRVGRWVDFKNSYKTMDNTYIESVWWALKKLHEKGLLYEGRKVLMYCPHCETPLAKAEIAMDNTYKDITEEAVTVKLKVKDPKKHGLPENTFILAWTTTPWTLPGNVGLAVGEDIAYLLISYQGQSLIIAEKLRGQFSELAQPLRKFAGSELIGIEYEPLYEVSGIKAHKGKKHVILPADFVSTEEGTGIVHTAVMYGEDDFMLGQKENLPQVQLLNPNGTYNNEVPEFIRGKYIKDAEKDIKRDLESRGLLFERKNHTHSYPHCYRCGTPLIYNAVASWFINIQKVKDKMLSENEKVTWVPEHLKHGRFKNIVESAPDWTISRNRFWASPLPVWKEKSGSKVMIIGSLDELKKKAKKSGNRYFLMRHGESSSNIDGTVSSDIHADIGVTKEGVETIRRSIPAFSERIDVIYASPFKRTKQTAEIAADMLGISKEKIVYDERLVECQFGAFSGGTMEEYKKAFPDRIEHFTKGPEGGETYNDIKKRMGAFLWELEQGNKGKNFLIVSHGTPMWLLLATVRGYDKQQTVDSHATEYPKQGEVRELPFAPIPVNANFELDLHRPYTDSIILVDDEGREYERIPEVVDCWVESGAMPFAEYHYPLENRREFESRAPGDFIAEYIAQTRTWFYYMHAMGVLLFDRLAFRSVVSTGTILAADGSKMSKSKGNYTDPLLVMDRYGADALRFHLLGSVVMQAEDLRFRDEDVRDAANRVIGILWNTFKFFELYKDQLASSFELRASSSPHPLDRWILARLNQTVRSVTDVLDAYDTPPATRILKEFIDEYSTWYVRRSRERVKANADPSTVLGASKSSFAKATEDKQYALATQREVLLTIAKMLAPIAPFIAESIYRGVGGELESVHLESWPKAREPNFLSRLFGTDSEKQILDSMASVRRLVTRALEARDKAGVRVRQPLAKLTVSSKDISTMTDRDALLVIIADEVNVKEVAVSDSTASGSVELDTNLTDELREEGFVRDLIRSIQGMRKDKGLTPNDLVDMTFTGTSDMQKILGKYGSEIKSATKADNIVFVQGSAGAEAEGGLNFSFKLEPKT